MSNHNELSIEVLAQKLASYVNNNWEKVLDKQRDELIQLFPEYEDATYGMYLDKLLPPVWKQVEQYGYKSANSISDNDFVIAGFLIFNDSLEKAKWGKPTHEYRVFWITIENEVGKKIGTLLFELSHSHEQFDLPAAPTFSFLNIVDKEEIKQEILNLKEKRK